jgi:anaerobic magnesium-protoporphyrin IX monomethyl ester cyclase
MLNYIDKQVTPEMTLKAVKAITEKGINVKGYFILGFPTETLSELQDTVRQIHRLWEISDNNPGTFRCSAFEFRPYPGTPEWHRLMSTGKYKSEDLLSYEHVDLTDNGQLDEMLERDEFNFSVNIQFGEVPPSIVRNYLTEIMVMQRQRLKNI